MFIGGALNVYGRGPQNVTPLWKSWLRAWGTQAFLRIFGTYIQTHIM